MKRDTKRRSPLAVMAAAIVTLITSLFGISYATSPTHYVTYVTGDMRDVDVTNHMGVKGAVQPDEVREVGPSTLQLAPQLDWTNLDVMDGSTMIWCLTGTQSEDFRQSIRNQLNRMQANYPLQTRDDGSRAGYAWRESCAGDQRYTLGDNAHQAYPGCGDTNAWGCAAVQGIQFRGAHVSINSDVVQRGQLRSTGIKTVAEHENGHAIGTSGHTGCGAVPDADPSVMSPINASTQLACHTPPASEYGGRDFEPAKAKYRLKHVSELGAPPPAPPPAPTPTPQPPELQERRTFLRWVTTQDEPGCRVTAGLDWCVTTVTGPVGVPVRGFFLQGVDERGQAVNWPGLDSSFIRIDP